MKLRPKINKRHTRTAALLAVGLAMLPVSGFASATDWQEIAPQVRARLISSDTLSSENTLRLGLEIDMPYDTKTYWRVPGDSGIPAQFIWTHDEAVLEARTRWPFPERDVEPSGALSYVYHGDLIIPLDLKFAEKISSTALKLDILMGICSDICVPVSVSFDQPVQTLKKDFAQSARIAVAYSTVPLVWPQDSIAPVGQISVVDSGALLEFSLDRTMLDPQKLIIEPLIEGWFADAPVYDAARDMFTARLHTYGNSDQLTAADFRYVFETRDGPFEYVAPGL